jgi:hypothetical protein
MSLRASNTRLEQVSCKPLPTRQLSRNSISFYKQLNAPKLNLEEHVNWYSWWMSPYYIIYYTLITRNSSHCILMLLSKIFTIVPYGMRAVYLWLNWVKSQQKLEKDPFFPVSYALFFIFQPSYPHNYNNSGLINHLVFYLKHNVSETAFCPRLHVEPIYLGSIQLVSILPPFLGVTYTFGVNR